MKSIFGSALIAMSALDDNVRATVSIPIFQTDDYTRFKQNSLNQDTDHDKCLRKLGSINLDCILEAGLSDYHKKYAKRSNNLQQSHEAWATEQALNRRLLHDEKLQAASERARERRSQRACSTTGASVNFADVTDQIIIDKNRPSSEDLTTRSPDLVYTNLSNVEKEFNHEEEWSDDLASLESSHSHRTFKTWLSDIKEEKKGLHRQHQGAFKRKPIRTAAWLKNGAKSSVSRVSRALSLKKEDDIVEKEV